MATFVSVVRDSGSRDVRALFWAWPAGVLLEKSPLPASDFGGIPAGFHLHYEVTLLNLLSHTINVWDHFALRTKWGFTCLSLQFNKVQLLITNSHTNELVSGGKIYRQRLFRFEPYWGHGRIWFSQTDCLGAAKINPVSWPPASTNAGCSHYRLYDIYCVQRSMQLHLLVALWSRSWRQQIGNTWSRLLVIILSTIIKPIAQTRSGCDLRDSSSKSAEDGAEAPEIFCTSNVVPTSGAQAERKSKPYISFKIMGLYIKMSSNYCPLLFIFKSTTYSFYRIHQTCFT